MPNRARSICPRCRSTYTPGRGCPTCAARTARDRPKPFAYDSPDWKATRAGFLANNPACCLCGRRARVADHWPKSRRELVQAGVPDPDGWHRLRPLCRPCHGKETARNQPSGWNARDD